MCTCSSTSDPIQKQPRPFSYHDPSSSYFGWISSFHSWTLEISTQHQQQSGCPFCFGVTCFDSAVLQVDNNRPTMRALVFPWSGHQSSAS
jgi:hypothetical protein